MQLPAGCGQGWAQVGELACYGSAAAAAQALGIALPDSVLRSVPTRQLEFISGRLCACAALRAAGLAAPPAVGMGRDRAPLWPPGYVGSITHAGGFAWAVATPRSLLRSLGVDLERVPDASAANELLPQLLAPGEAPPQIPGWDEPRRIALAFSAKESAYKCLAAFGASELGFQDLQLTAVEPEAASLRMRLLRAFAPHLRAGLELAGGFSSEGPLLRTWVVWPAD